MIHEDFKIQGWIRVYRKMLHWGWFRDSHMVHIFIYLMLRANRLDGTWRGLKIKPGQLATGIRSISKDTGISIRSVRTCLYKMRLTHEVTIESTHVCSIITICNYQYYNNLTDDAEYSTGKKKKKTSTHPSVSKGPLKTGTSADSDEEMTHKKATHISTHISTHKATHHKKTTNKSSLIDYEGSKIKSTQISTQISTQKATPNKNIENIENIKNNKSPENEFREADKKSDYLDQIIEIFCAQYKVFHKADYEVLNRKKERAAAAKISQVYKKQNPDNDTVKALKDLGDYFSACIGIDDRWLRDNMCLPIINSKFNSINNILRNGKDRTNSKKVGATDGELAEIIGRKFAVKK